MRKNSLSTFITLFICCKTLHAQQPYADCDKAITIEEGASKYVLLSGKGEREIQSDNAYLFSEEHNTCWVKMDVKTAGVLTIDIEPGDPSDVNFILFRYTDENFCKDVKLRKISPLRADLAPGKGKTGLSAGAKEELISMTSNEQYVKSIEVKAGEQFCLVVDHDSPKGGNVMISWNVSKDGANGRAPVQLNKGDLAPSVELNVKIIDDETGSPVVADVAVAGLVPSETVRENTGNFISSLSSSQSIRIDCTAPGYMIASQSIMAPQLDPNDPLSFAPLVVEMRLKKIKEGDKVALKSIKFQADKAEFIPGAYPTLQSLVTFLKTNPKVKIEIGGHINGPDGSSSAGKAMSKKRAKAVYDYLVKSGIEKGRLKYKGYGNSQMIYPAPMNERQADENRRVEIKIISK
jgi:outer membrane protein OmpA-like peptidoglycan-associated protein